MDVKPQMSGWHPGKSPNRIFASSYPKKTKAWTSESRSPILFDGLVENSWPKESRVKSKIRCECSEMNIYIYRWVFSTKTTWVLMFQVFQLPQKFWHPIFFGKPIDSTWRSNRPGKSEQEVIELKQMAKEEEEERERIRLEKLKQDWRTVQVHDHQRSEFFFL